MVGLGNLSRSFAKLVLDYEVDRDLSFAAKLRDGDSFALILARGEDFYSSASTIGSLLICRSGYSYIFN